MIDSIVADAGNTLPPSPEATHAYRHHHAHYRQPQLRRLRAVASDRTDLLQRGRPSRSHSRGGDHRSRHGRYRSARRPDPPGRRGVNSWDEVTLRPARKVQNRKIVSYAGKHFRGTRMENNPKKESRWSVIWSYVMAALRGLAFGRPHIRILVQEIEKEDAEEQRHSD